MALFDEEVIAEVIHKITACRSPGGRRIGQRLLELEGLSSQSALLSQDEAIRAISKRFSVLASGLKIQPPDGHLPFYLALRRRQDSA